MGQEQSQPNNKTSITVKDTINIFQRRIDNIAYNYITSQSFKDMLKLKDKEYCNKLNIITSDILKKYFNDREINYLAKRVENGVDLNAMTADSIVYFRNDMINEELNNTDKDNMCISISKFYIKIAHLYSAIYTSIGGDDNSLEEGDVDDLGDNNDNYSSEDDLGNIDGEYSELNYESYDETEYKLGLCRRRLFSLIDTVLDEDNIELKHISCIRKEDEIENTDIYKENALKSLNERSLKNMYGIPELEMLYYDVFDYTLGKYVGMSVNSKRSYMKDLEDFYKVFTGKIDKPENIIKFSDILLSDYCGINDIKDKIIISKKDTLYKKYAEHLAQSIKNTNNYQKELINILNQVFNNEGTNILPDLDEKKLNILIEETRSVLVRLYIDCEKDYKELFNIFEAIIEEQTKKNNLRKMQNIEKEKYEMI